MDAAATTTTLAVDFVNLFRDNRPGDFTFAMIKPDAMEAHLDVDICNMILGTESLHILMDEVRPLSATDVRALYYEHVGKFFYERNEAFILSRSCRLLLLVGFDAQRIWREVLMPQIRDRWGRHNTCPEMKHLNLVHGSDNWNNAFREVQYFFG